MAKSNSLIQLRGTIVGLTFVNSRAYGEHVRAPRGTYKKAEVNDAFKKESAVIVSANVPAKIIKDAIDPYRTAISGGMLWQRLVSFFRTQVKMKHPFDFSTIAPFEIHDEFPFDRFLEAEPSVRLDKKKSSLRIKVLLEGRPIFPDTKEVDGYRLSLIGIFPNLKKKFASTTSVEFEVIKAGKPAAPLQADLPVPRNAKSYLVCIRIEGCAEGKVADMRTATGLKIIGSGKM